MNEDDSPLTHGELQRFVHAFCKGLEAPMPGAVVLPHEVQALHSESLCEDGKTVMRLYDLVDGRTGVQSFLKGETPGHIWCAG